MKCFCATTPAVRGHLAHQDGRAIGAHFKQFKKLMNGAFFVKNGNDTLYYNIPTKIAELHHACLILPALL